MSFSRVAREALLSRLRIENNLDPNRPPSRNTARTPRRSARINAAASGVSNQDVVSTPERGELRVRNPDPPAVGSVTSTPRAADGEDDSGTAADEGDDTSGTASVGEHDSSGNAATDRAAARQSARMQLMRSGRPQPVRTKRQGNAARATRAGTRGTSERDADDSGDEDGDEAGRTEENANEPGSVAGRAESDETPTYDICTPHFESMVVRVASRTTGETKLVRINLREGIVVDGDECTFKCEDVEE